MTTIASLIIFIGLLGVALIHFVWAFGSTFPAGNERILARTVAGFKGIEKMPPPAASAAVAILVSIFSLWPFVMSGQFKLGFPNWFTVAGGFVLMVVFGLRGILGFTKFWQDLTPEQPFSTLDQKYYSPFCLLICLCFAIIVLGKLS